MFVVRWTVFRLTKCSNPDYHARPYRSSLRSSTLLSGWKCSAWTWLLGRLAHLPVGVGRSSSRWFPAGEMKLSYRSFACTVCTSVQGASSLTHGSGNFLENFFLGVCCRFLGVTLFMSKLQVKNIVGYSAVEYPTGLAIQCRVEEVLYLSVAMGTIWCHIVRRSPIETLRASFNETTLQDADGLCMFGRGVSQLELPRSRVVSVITPDINLFLCPGSSRRTCKYLIFPVFPKYCRYNIPSSRMIRASWVVYCSALLSYGSFSSL